MAQVLEKTVKTLNALVLPSPQNTVVADGVSFQLQAFLKKVTQAKTKKEEAIAVSKQLELVRRALEKPGVKTTVTRSCLVYAMYCKLLGYSAEFAYIHALKLAQQSASVMEKHTGYLACCLFFHEQDEWVVLFVNGLLRDLASTNPLEVNMALVAICHFLPAELTPTVLPMVCERLGHTSDYIRRKALVALHYIFRKCPEQSHLIMVPVRKALGDANPGVVAASLQLLEDLAKEHAFLLTDLVPAIIAIQKQILQNKLPAEYHYKSMVAPWMQMSIMRLLRFLSSDKECSQTEAILQETFMACYKQYEPIYVATAHECILTMLETCSNFPLETVIQYTSQLMGNPDENLCHTGLSLLGALLKMHAVQLPSDFRTVVTRALCHPDFSIQHKSLQILACLAREENAYIICNHMLNYMEKCQDSFLLQEVTHSIIDVSRKHGSNKSVSIGILFKVLAKSSETCVGQIVKRIKDILTTASDAGQDVDLKNMVLQLALKILASTNVFDSVVELCLWIISYCCKGKAMSLIVLDDLVALGKTWLRRTLTETQVELWLSLLHTLQTVILQAGESGTQVTELLNKTSNMANMHLKLQSKELQVLCHLNIMPEGSEREPDFTLSFMDQFVVDALKAGSKPYQPKLLCKLKGAISIKDPHTDSLEFTPYPMSGDETSCPESFGIESWSTKSEDIQPSFSRVVSEAAKVWSRAGRLKGETLEGTQSQYKMPEACDTHTQVPVLEGQKEKEVTLEDPLSQLLNDGFPSGFNQNQLHEP